MPRLVAIDFGPVVGLFSRNDVNHAAAVVFFRAFADQGFITVPVITEVMHLLSFRVDAQLDFLAWVRGGALTIVNLEAPDWDRTIESPAGCGDPSLIAEDLPGQAPALLPAGPLRPHKDYIAVLVDRQSRVLALARGAGGGLR